MRDTVETLRRKIGSATDLHGVVRTMKAMAASSITQYKNSSKALVDYHRSIELGLGACFRYPIPVSGTLIPVPDTGIGYRKIAIVFASDQGLVGKFNDVVADFVIEELGADIASAKIWVVGARISSRIEEGGGKIMGLFPVPNSVEAITPLVGDILLNCGDLEAQSVLYLFYNETKSGSGYKPKCLRLLPLDSTWRLQLIEKKWPTNLNPEIFGDGVLESLIREHLFIALFRACAESLAAENASRLAAMQRADKNIEELLEGLQRSFHQMRQSRIDEELFDLISGFETLGGDV